MSLDFLFHLIYGRTFSCLWLNTYFDKKNTFHWTARHFANFQIEGVSLLVTSSETLNMFSCIFIDLPDIWLIWKLKVTSSELLDM